MLRKLIPIIMLAMVVLLVPQQEASGQFNISDSDTFRIVDAFGQPGQVVPIEVFVANNSSSLLAINTFIDIDTNVIQYEGVVDQGTFFVNTQPLPRARESIDPPDSNIFNFQPLVMVSSNNKRSSLLGAGDGGAPGDQVWLAPGRGKLFQFFVRVRDDVTEGTQATVRFYQPFQEVPGDTDRVNQYADNSGVTIYPRIVSGTFTVGSDPDPGEENSPPSIAPLAQTDYIVDPGDPINFTVSATDPDSPQPITLRVAQALPSGATFGTGGEATGAGSVSAQFSWTPNAAQVNNYTFTFTCEDDSGATATPRSVSITVRPPDEPEGDLLFTNSQPDIGPIRGGTPGLTGLTIPVNLVSTQAVYGIQFDFVYDQNVLVIDSLVPTDRLENFTIYDNIGDTPGRVRVVAFGLNNEQIQSGATSAIMDFWVTVRGSAAVGEYPIGFENAFEAVSPDPFVPSVELEVDPNGLFVVDAGGDVNGDGRVDIADMVVVVGYIINQVELDIRQFTAADMDRNSFVDVVDLQAIINQVFGGTPPSFSGYGGDEATLELLREAPAGSASLAELYAELPTDVAGVQFEIKYDPEKVKLSEPLKTGMSDRLSLRYNDDGAGKMIVLLYPGEGLDRYMTPGAGTLLDVPMEQQNISELTDDDLKIKYAVMVDPEALEIPVKNLGRNVVLPEEFTLSQNYPNPFNPETTIDFAIDASTAQRASLKIYNLLGQHIHTLVDDVLPPGNYSYKWYGRMDNGEAAASGVYFYRLMVGDNAKTRKMILLK